MMGTYKISLWHYKLPSEPSDSKDDTKTSSLTQILSNAAHAGTVQWSLHRVITGFNKTGGMHLCFKICVLDQDSDRKHRIRSEYGKTNSACEEENLPPRSWFIIRRETVC